MSWIKFSERVPTDSDLPIECSSAGQKYRAYHDALIPDWEGVFAWWRSLPRDLPPVELSEEEKARNEAVKSAGIENAVALAAFRFGWNEALAWERGRKAKASEENDKPFFFALIEKSGGEMTLWEIFEAGLKRGRRG